MKNSLTDSIIYHIGSALHESLHYQDNISIILNDDTEILPEELDDHMYPVFIKISTPSLIASDNEILIGINQAHFVSFDHLCWQTSDVEIQTAEDEKLNVFDKCEHMQKYVKSNYRCGKTPALSYCADRHIMLSGTPYKGYLPSLSQLEIISEHLDYINEILDYLGIESLRIDNAWSSDEYDEDTAWAFYEMHPLKILKNMETFGNKQIRAIPVFKKHIMNYLQFFE